MTRVLGLDAGLDAAVAVLRAGGLVIHPTETVYGIGALRSGAGAICAAKGSPPGRPFLCVAANAEQAFGLWSRVPDLARALAAEHWPGPLSLIGPAGEGTVGVRVPGHPGLRRLLAALGEPMISTSANRAGEPPSTTFPRDLLGVALALDGGPCPGGTPSTILDLTSAPPRVLRPGPVGVGY